MGLRVWKATTVRVAHRGEARTRLGRREAQRPVQAVPRQVEHPRPAGEIVARPACGLDDERVRAVPAAQHRAHLAQAVVRVDLVHLEQRQDVALLVGQRDLVGGAVQRVLAHRHRQRDREERAVLEAHLVRAPTRTRPARHEPVERREGPDREHLEVVLRAQRERDLGQALRPLEQRATLVLARGRRGRRGARRTARSGADAGRPRMRRPAGPGVGRDDGSQQSSSPAVVRGLGATERRVGRARLRHSRRTAAAGAPSRERAGLHGRSRTSYIFS